MNTSGVTIITVTNKAGYLNNLFLNYKRQLWKTKELIIILNNNKLNMSAYKNLSFGDRRVSVYRLPNKVPLGVCLNYGVQRAKYGVIAKFDDDDYYAPLYLSEAMGKFRQTRADIVGKRKFYMYLEGSKKLLLASKSSSRSVAGATIMFKKKLYPAVKFSRLRVGSDMRFLRDGLNRGYKLRSTSQYHFAAVRRANQSSHTWKITPKTLKNLQAKIVAQTPHFRRIVSRNR